MPDPFHIGPLRFCISIIMYAVVSRILPYISSVGTLFHFKDTLPTTDPNPVLCNPTLHDLVPQESNVCNVAYTEIHLPRFFTLVLQALHNVHYTNYKRPHSCPADYLRCLLLQFHRLQVLILADQQFSSLHSQTVLGDLLNADYFQ